MPSRRLTTPAATDSAAALPASLFFATPAQRAALARERYFEEGVRPSGLVPEAVIQSWARCLGSRREPGERIAFDPVTKARIAGTQARNRQLLDAAKDDLRHLGAALAGTSCWAILTSHDGVVVHATPAARHVGRVLPCAARVGVDLGEGTIGTGAPGLAACTGDVSMVQGAEHFFNEISVMYCAAAPIRDARGEIAAVLDLSSEGEMFRFDAASMVRVFAAGIENRLLVTQSREQVLLRFQASPNLLRTPLEGLAAVGGDGRVMWVNGSGASLLGCARVLGRDACCETLFGLTVESLLALAHGGRTNAHRLPSGLALWLEARLPNDTRASEVVAAVELAPAPAPAPPPRAEFIERAPASSAKTLKDADRDLIERTLAECGGNVSSAARRLGVSRGLLYRRLRECRETAD